MLGVQQWSVGPSPSPKGYWQCRKSKSKSSKVRVGWPQTTEHKRVSDDGEAAVADPWTSEESKAYHHVQGCIWSCIWSSQRIHADATTSISSNVSWHQQLHTEILFTPEQSPSGTTLTKNLPKRLPSTASRVACISPPSPFVDVIPHIGSLSTIPDPEYRWNSFYPPEHYIF